MYFKTIIILIFLSLHYKSFSQNKLEFNQIITYDTAFTGYPINNYVNYLTDTLIVPENKVWKIEFLKIDASLQYFINNAYLDTYYEEQYGGGVSIIPLANNKIWLKSGDQIYAKYRYYCNGCGSQDRSIFISIIEFNTTTN